MRLLRVQRESITFHKKSRCLTELAVGVAHGVIVVLRGGVSGGGES